MKPNWINDWTPLLEEEWSKEYMQRLQDFIEIERENEMIYPPESQVFRALELTPLHQVKVVILGQDPYHGERQANGLSFSVEKGVPIPKSLQNIFKELQDDLQVPIPKHGDLTNWAKQGVLLLNTTLTVRKGKAFTHKGKGWDQFTNTIIQHLNNREDPILFILWGKPAQQKEIMIDTDRHGVIKAPHPSPLSAYRGFFGSHPFSRANAWLEEKGLTPIEWKLP
ncbi:uracil-DNA glycosylase [Mangrovibacillus cuniculi]|uniref:Uracil-DNA glycosylase n=1 Tax=Mangrovibacillus cuniculi TaxID=2593652 RepID=A0A7S8CDC8_9BACI|nr:uracil-DNA glycosylase [Mangrovibacillus cuniculi]QPC47771.1 uracil-DNA glycosylase [Mangrovibacillus cuniculi]